VLFRSVLILVAYFLHIPFYTLLFFGISFILFLPYFGSVLVGVLSILLPSATYEGKEDPRRKRYKLTEISAALVTAYYVAFEFVYEAFDAPLESEIFSVLVTIFVLLFVFYLLLSVGDVLAVLVVVNAVLLTPAALGQDYFARLGLRGQSDQPSHEKRTTGGRFTGDHHISTLLEGGKKEHNE
jgi:hypothetical protein